LDEFINAFSKHVNLSSIAGRHVPTDAWPESALAFGL
jgi:hypothetical protein